MIFKKSLLCLICCKIYGVYLEYENPVKVSETRYGHKLLCIPRCIPINQVKDNKLLSRIIMNSEDSNQEEDFSDTRNDICGKTELLLVYTYCMDCVVVRKADPRISYEFGWGFMIKFLPNKLKRPVHVANKSNKQLPVPEIENPETPDLILSDNSIY